ncbi:MAG: hypothetical protein KAS35_03585 [Candidatus Marinimicrobia bacterium]|nr:hypothetical protein [Candidatus Neomarinimicrobiota bacterium]
MKNKQIKRYALIVAFLGVAIVFYTQSQTTLAQFLIFLFSGILVGINICKIKNANKDV